MPNIKKSKTALFYFHDFRCKDLLSYSFRNRWYEVKNVGCIEEMLEEVEKGKYNWILIDDSNVKALESLDISEAHRVYKAVKEKGVHGETKFLLLSFFQQVLDKAHEEGIPAMEKRDFDGRLNEIVGKKI